jgi:hypothetical protein
MKSRNLSKYRRTGTPIYFAPAYNIRSWAKYMGENYTSSPLRTRPYFFRTASALSYGKVSTNITQSEE